MPPDPEQALTVRPIRLGDKSVPAYSRVWVWSRSDESAEVEFGNHRGRVPADALVPFPVKGPGLHALRQLDPCFGLDDAAFELEHVDQDRYFVILRCKAHGRLFLRDTRGSSIMYNRTTLLREEDEGSPREIWSRHHNMSEDQLLLCGRTL